MKKINTSRVDDNEKINFKKLFYQILALFIIVASVYVYGTFNPNSWAEKKIIRQAEQRAVDNARFLGFQQPEFRYNDNQTFVTAVQKCVDYLNLMTDPHHRIPSAIIVGMAVIESDYGRSRFATEGNALFGVRTWDPKVPQMKPLSIPNAQFGVKKYTHKCESVSDMINIINNHPAYEPFRKIRDDQYDTNKFDYKKMLYGLSAWSTNPDYAEIVMGKIKQLQLP